MKIYKVRLVDSVATYKCIPGAVLSVSEKSFMVKTKDIFLEVLDFSYSQKIKVGDRFEA